MLGRKEEEIEREEVERQMREVDMQEQMQHEIEEGERQRDREAQARQEAAGVPPGVDERDLDDEVPEAEGDPEDDEEEDEEEHDLDDDVPEADVSGWHYDTRISPEPGEGETGITDDVERSHLGDGQQIPSMFHAGMFASEHEAIANAMLEEDEMEGAGEQDLDDEVPDADMDVDEEGWEHTDTELEESEMDISISILPTAQQVQHQQPAPVVGRNQRVATPITVESSVAEIGRRSWLGGSPRRNLFGRNNAGNAASLFTPPPAAPQSPVLDSLGEDSMRAQRFGRAPRRGANLVHPERENRDSLD